MLGKQRQLNPWGLLARQPNRWAQVSETVWKVTVLEEQHLELSSYVCMHTHIHTHSTAYMNMHTHKLIHSCFVFFWNPKGKGSRQTLGWTIPWACWKGGPQALWHVFSGCVASACIDSCGGLPWRTPRCVLCDLVPSPSGESLGFVPSVEFVYSGPLCLEHEISCDERVPRQTGKWLH